MKELEKNELMDVDGGKLLERLTWVGMALWVMENWAEIKQGASDGWTECHSTQVDAVTSAS